MMNQSLDQVVTLDVEELKLYQCNDLNAFKQLARNRLPNYTNDLVVLKNRFTQKLGSVKTSGWLLLVGVICAFIGVSNFLHQEWSDQIATVLAVLAASYSTVLMVRDYIDLVKEKGAMELMLNKTNALREFLRRCEIAKWQIGCP
jgi:uncharacterized membrane protein YfcA